MTNPALQDIEHQLEPDVDMSIGDAAGRNRRHVHRQLGRADILGAHSDLVLDVIPAPAVAAAADHEDPVASFDALARVDVATAGKWEASSFRLRMINPTAIRRLGRF